MGIDYQSHADKLTGLVRQMTDFYLRTEASTGKKLAANQGILVRNNYATPRLMLPLIEYLQALTDLVSDRMTQMATACASVGNMTLACRNPGGIQGDLVNWKKRLRNYVEQTKEAFKRNPDASGDQDPTFWAAVTQPILLGWFPGKERQRRLDLVTPMVMSFQVDVVRSSKLEVEKMFWGDLKDAAKQVGVRVGVSVGTILLLMGLASAAAYGYAKGGK